MLLRLQRIQAKGIVEVYRAVACIWIEICSLTEPQRVFAEEAPDGRIVVSSPIVVKASFRVVFARRVLEGVSQGASGGRLIAEGIECVGSAL